MPASDTPWPPHRGKACCVWLLMRIWSIAPRLAEALSHWLTGMWPGWKEQ